MNMQCYELPPSANGEDREEPICDGSPQEEATVQNSDGAISSKDGGIGEQSSNVNGKAVGQYVDIHALRIRTLNDVFRNSFLGGRVMLTEGITTLDTIVQAEIISKVRRFNAFNDGNDPYREHDFGCIEHAGETVFFKIDYYDLTLEQGSPDPADAKLTTRVLTIMLASEW